MNKFFTIIALVCVTILANAQIIPNGNFENWSTITIDYPTNYPMNSNYEAIRNNSSFNLEKTSDAYHGLYAVKIATGKDGMFGYFFNSKSQGEPDQWTGGAPMTETPRGIRGYYKYNTEIGDTATIIVSCRKGGTSIGMFLFNMGGVKTDYTLFDFNFEPALTETPDSIVVAFASSDVMNNRSKEGSVLYVDSVSFTGITTQPELLNGDFELWSSSSVNYPDAWKQEANIGGVDRTTDSYEGSYAIQLESMLDGNKNRTSSIMTGEWVEVAPGDYKPMGGFPYTEMKDTLVFYYKYVSGIEKDTAEVNMFFKKDGNQILGMEWDLLVASEYTKVELPFVMGMAPDTAIISVRSGSWKNDSLIFAGAILKIDDMQFKSQSPSTSIFNNVSEENLIVYPNPSNEQIYVLFPNGTENVTLKDLQGRILASKTFSSSVFAKYCTFDLTDLSAGIYVVSVSAKNKVSTAKFTVQH